MRELLTVKEAAKRMGVSARTLYRAVKAGKYLLETPNRREYLVWEDGQLIKADVSKESK